jgi:hypothetical protein
MRIVTFKKQDGAEEDFVTSLTSFELDQEDPFGVSYRSQCSSTLSPSDQEEFWDYVDSLLLENPTPDFHSVWKIVDNGITFGYQN